MTNDSVLGEPVLAAARISKSFGSVQALVDVDVTVRSGEVLAIVGENGAGKSTLLKILAGVLSPDEGQLSVAGDAVTFRSPRDARASGIAAVYQDLALVEELDIATNLFLGDFPRRGLLIDRRRMDVGAAKLLERMNLGSRSPRTPVGALTGGHRQFVAFARALRLNSPVLVMDEPTAALGITERADMADLLRGLRDDGRAIVVVSHDLEFVMDVADKIQVLRLGRCVGVQDVRTTNRDELVGLIMGVAG